MGTHTAFLIISKEIGLERRSIPVIIRQQQALQFSYQVTDKTLDEADIDRGKLRFVSNKSCFHNKVGRGG
jgi:hypothetical protein